MQNLCRRPEYFLSSLQRHTAVWNIIFVKEIKRCSSVAWMEQSGIRVSDSRIALRFIRATTVAAALAPNNNKQLCVLCASAVKNDFNTSPELHFVSSGLQCASAGMTYLFCTTLLSVHRYPEFLFQFFWLFTRPGNTHIKHVVPAAA